jgi:hypothetical protein
LRFQATENLAGDFNNGEERKGTAENEHTDDNGYNQQRHIEALVSDFSENFLMKKTQSQLIGDGL